MALHSHYDYEGLHLMMFVTIITTAHPWEVSYGALILVFKGNRLNPVHYVLS